MKTRCATCGAEFLKRGQNHKRCDPCARSANLANMRRWKRVNVVTGQGSGALPGEANSNYKHGICVMRGWAKDRLAELNNCCERCGSSIDAARRGTWAGHHKDHDRSNNTPENLEVLCKRCHQVEHECWLAFQGATTIPKGSTPETAEAPSTQAGDDIVCSA